MENSLNYETVTLVVEQKTRLLNVKNNEYLDCTFVSNEPDGLGWSMPNLHMN
jgi:hypothetical protein